MKKRISPLKVASIVTVMIPLLVGCQRNENSKSINTTSDSTVESLTVISAETTTEFSTLEPTSYDPTRRPVNPDLPETEALTESFEYTIYEEFGHPTTIHLPVQTEDYISNNGDVYFFDMDHFADDFGWKQNTGHRFENGKTVEYSYYYYDCGEMWLYFELEYLEDIDLHGKVRNCLGRFKYAFIFPGEPEHYYFEPNNEFATATNNAYMYLTTYPRDKTLYRIRTDEELYAYEDEIVLISYVFSFVSRYPNYNPLCFKEFEEWRSRSYYPISSDYPWDRYDTSNW